MEEHIVKLKLLENEVSSCVKCKLHSSRIKPVFARGNPNAFVCIIGQNPGVEETKHGIPFIGRSGKLLDRAVEELGYNTESDIYILNAVKCHSPNNRIPEPEEVQACEPYLEQHIELLPAQIIITLGSFPMMILTDETRGITKSHGTWSKWKTKEVIKLYHPSYILRQGGLKSEAYSQFKNDLKLAFEKANSLKESK